MRRDRVAPPWRILVVALLAQAPIQLTAATARAQSADHSPEVFVDRADEVGLDFVYFNGMTGRYYLPEIVGAGGALFDYDNDGDLDLYLVQGHLLGSGTIEQAREYPAGPLRDRLFRNDLLGPASSGRLELTEVPLGELAEGHGYAVGVASGDYDNDGWTDLYITALGPNRLLRNRGDGSFEDVTRVVGAQDARWSVPAIFFDFDRDGWLDLFVGNYVDYSVETNKECRTLAGSLDYCGPLSYAAAPDSLWHNSGDGAFEEVSARAGTHQTFGNALGAISADFDGDGWQDLFVANDGVPNQLWINQGDGTFRDEALLSGTAVNSLGRPEASMGVTAGDFDNDGDLDVFLTHLAKETNTLYRNEGSGFFEDATTVTRLGAPSLPYTGFGTAFLDYDNDGWLDLVVVNGAVHIPADGHLANSAFPLDQPNQLYRNTGDGHFENVTAIAGSSFHRSEVSRGLLTGDLDNDGDVDLVIVNNGSPTRLLINEVGHENHWLGLRLVVGEGLHDDLGAWVAVHREGSQVLRRQVTTGGSYGSASDPRLLFGLGEEPEIERVVAVWTDGLREEWQVQVDRHTVLRKGRGRALGRAGS